MNWIKTNAVALVAVVLSIIAIFLGMKSGVVQTLGAQVQNDLWYFTGGTQVTRDGTGTTLNNVIVGSCNMSAFSNITASTTGYYECAAAGVLKGDTIIADISKISTTTFGGYVIVGATASTTNGFIDFTVLNFSGGTGIPPAAIASSTEFIDIR